MATITKTTSAQTIHLLVVDGHPTDLEATVDGLLAADPEHYVVDWAASFEDGLFAAQTGNYDVFLLEYALSARFGPDFFRIARLSGTIRPIILLTEEDELEVNETMAAAGVVDCLPKMTLAAARLEQAIRGAVRHAKTLSILWEAQKRLRSELEVAQKREGQLLAAITDNLPIMVGRLNAAGRVVEISGRGLAAQGMMPGRLLGRTFAELYPATADTIAKTVAGTPANCEIHGGEGDEEWHVEFFAFPDASCTSAVVFFGRDVTSRKNLERRLIHISDAEQQRIGADLHDGLGQHLTGTACIAAALREKLKADNSPYSGQAATVASLINAAIDMTRGFARGLCPVQIEVGSLCSALEDFTFQVQRLHQVKCRFRPTGKPLSLPQYVALHLYRIAQEAVNNALRHSSADEIVIILDRAYLAIEDNGCGFDPAAVSDKRRLGLRLMEYRTAMIGGSFKITRRPQGGMRAECVFAQPFS